MLYFLTVLIYTYQKIVIHQLSLYCDSFEFCKQQFGKTEIYRDNLKSHAQNKVSKVSQIMVYKTQITVRRCDINMVRSELFQQNSQCTIVQYAL